ncbi:MAG: MarR family transcriptional regulator [Methylophaga sp.]|nr:MAG: MarR family transcriptional regulator [Methylophaga sp.]
MNIQTPHSRNSDPESSHLAGDAITKSGKRQRQIDLVVGLVQGNPNKTSAELAKVSGYDRAMIARRLPDAEGIYLKRAKIRICTENKTMAQTWVMT